MSFREKKRILLGLTIAGMIAVALVISTAFAAALQKENNRLEQANGLLSDQIERLNIELSTSNNSGRIEELAKEKLGMVFPGEDQVVFLTEKDAPPKEFASIMKRTVYN